MRAGPDPREASFILWYCSTKSDTILSKTGDVRDCISYPGCPPGIITRELNEMIMRSRFPR
jgi:hypothetical protein